MKEIFKIIRNYICYCGIDKNEYNLLKKDAYKSNFEVWRVLHCLMALVFGALTISSLMVNMLGANMVFYMIGFVYSVFVACLFLFILKKDSILAQFIIYASISLLFVFGGFITQNTPASPGTTFMVLLLITPMLMIDKPYFMAIELLAASTVFLVWMYNVKPIVVWKMDLVNVVVYTFVGIFLNIIANSIRIKEFVLSRKITIQKDTDDLTGLKNKGATTRAINEFLSTNDTNKGIMLLLDIDHFKSINDNFGHDVGDKVINEFGVYLQNSFTNDEIVGRFGGDEFIVFIKNTDDTSLAEETANKIVDGFKNNVTLPETSKNVGVSIGIAIYQGFEKNYSEIFKKADLALYKTKADRTKKYNFYDPSLENSQLY